ncbi:hypothetical protein Cph01nite_34790 [Cellulomonas phragmiteti]|uniref:Uncharacterized protein n=1 Tax=Cellulomonas phragmiteti TaxID=478780 RepID=A0ABQ4DQU4_9CELL|nr:hypothetical protein Cph01nite_34790 [Cellulomonas phragmiteti]
MVAASAAGRARMRELLGQGAGVVGGCDGAGTGHVERSPGSRAEINNENYLRQLRDRRARVHGARRDGGVRRRARSL